jgi:DNA-binding CsgD family transcriptional regulator
MVLGLSIVFLLVLSIWVGRQEIAYSFAGLHIPEILSRKTFGIYLLLAFALGLGLVLFWPYPTIDLEGDRLYDLVTGMFLTYLIIRSLNIQSSMVTAFWGALCGLIYFQQPTMDGYPLPSFILSWLVFPLCSLPLTFLYKKWVDHFDKKTDQHLLLRFQMIREVAFAGVIICGIALACNYLLLFHPLLDKLGQQTSIGNTIHIIMLFAVALTCYLSTRHRVGIGFGSSKKMNQHVAMSYSIATTVLFSSLVSMLFSLPMPAVIASNQVKEANNLVLDKNRRNVHQLNITTISLLTPLLAFLLSILLASMKGHVYLKAATVVFIVTLSILSRLYFNQWRHHNKIKLVLNDELQRRTEADAEINRLDVLAVTSQFNVLSKEIDLKQKGLINLSLYLRQQRDYLEDMSKRLQASTRLNHIDDLKKEVSLCATELSDSIKLSEEMDQFFTQVDELHKNFVSRLMMRCPTISEREKRLAILLRLGYSSKEIANMMNIETKSVEISRYRLRKKLKLERNVNMVQYLQLL